MLIDTGAQMSIIKKKMLHHSVKLQAPPPGLNVSGVTGHPVKIFGLTEINCMIKNRVLPVTCLVVGEDFNIREDGILGIDFIRKYNADIMSSESALLVAGERIPINVLSCYAGTSGPEPEPEGMPTGSSIPVGISPVLDQVPVLLENEKLDSFENYVELASDDSDNEPSFAMLRERIEVPAHTQVQCFAVVSEYEPGQVFEFSPVELRQELLVLCMAAIVGENGQVPIFVSNISNKKETVEANTPLAQTVNLGKMASFRTEEQDQTPLLELLKLKGLDEPEKGQLIKLLVEFEDIFVAGKYTLGYTSLLQHKIETGDAKPYCRPPYRVPQSLENIVKSEIQGMLDNNIIRPSTSPWSAPFLLVARVLPGGQVKYRPCIDYRGLNSCTLKVYHPIINIEETINQLGGSRYFTLIDLCQGFFQIGMDPDSTEKTGFSTPFGHYEALRMPFGLCNAPATFSRLMSIVLTGLTGIDCFVYLDDIIIYSKTIPEHLTKLRRVFERLRSSGLRLKPSKCEFLRTSVRYLGYIVSREGVLPCPDKVIAISKYPEPSCLKSIRAFIGLVSYYRKHICNFADRSAKLTLLLRKNQPFVWGPEQARSFEDLKSALLSEKLMRYPDFNHPFRLATDASNIALGGILSQDINGDDRPISYISRQLKNAERNYSVTTLECLAVIWSIKAFRYYLYGRKFEVWTDHSSLQWLINLKDPSSRLARWSLLLSEYDFKIIHRPGSKMGHVDALSRISINTMQVPYIPVYDRSHVLKEQRAQEDLAKIAKLVEDNDPNALEKYFLDDDDLLYLKNPRGRHDLLMVPETMVGRLLRAYHDLPHAGHSAYRKTLLLIRTWYTWKHMAKQIKQYCMKCTTCRTRKARANPPAPLESFPEVNRPMQRLSLDIVGPLVVTESNNRYILTFCDVMTRWPEAFAIPDQKAETVARCFVEGIICRHGCPTSLLSDLGTNFLSRLFKEVCKFLGIERLMTTPYRPQGNSHLERSHQTLANLMAPYVSKDPTCWDQYLPFALLAYRATIHSGINDTPFHMMYLRDVILPFEDLNAPIRQDFAVLTNYRAECYRRMQDTYQLAKIHSREAVERSHEHFKKKARKPDFKLGDLVMYKIPAPDKLGPRWDSAWRIKEIKGPVTYRIVNLENRKEKIVHVNKLISLFPPGYKPEVEPENPGMKDLEWDENEFPTDTDLFTGDQTEEVVTNQTDTIPPIKNTEHKRRDYDPNARRTPPKHGYNTRSKRL